MTIEKVYDPMLEEMWGIKREIAAEHPSLDEYFKSFMLNQEQAEKTGHVYVRFAPQHVMA